MIPIDTIAFYNLNNAIPRYNPPPHIFSTHHGDNNVSYNSNFAPPHTTRLFRLFFLGVWEILALRYSL